MNGQNGKGHSVATWIVIIISILIAFSGMMFGILTNRASDNKMAIKALETRMTALESKFERIDERLGIIKELLEKHMNK